MRNELLKDKKKKKKKKKIWENNLFILLSCSCLFEKKNPLLVSFFLSSSYIYLIKIWLGVVAFKI